MDAADLRRAYRRWLLKLWHGDLALAAELVTDDFLIHQARSRPGESEQRRGPEALVELVQMGRSPFSELSFDIAVGPIVEDDMLCARWEGRGRYAGGIPGTTAAPGTEVAFAGIDILRAASDGRFAEYWVSSDGLALMAQLGAG